MEAPQNIHPEILSAIRLLSEDRIVNMDTVVSIIEDTVYNCDLSIYPDFSTGLAGIGYGIQYLICIGLIEEDADEVLEECDRHLFSAVYFRMHTDLTHATGLMGIASYFLGRLEDPNASDNNLSTLTSKSVLLSILDILLIRFGVEGYVSSEIRELPRISMVETHDVKKFIQDFLHYDICNELALKLQNRIEQNPVSPARRYNNSIDTDMSDVTIVMPIRVDSDDRIANLKTIIRLYSTLENIHFIIWEADNYQHLHIEENERISYSFCMDDNPVFHFTYYRNVMIKQAKTPIVIVWDVDVLVPEEQLCRAVDDVRNQQTVLSFPYDGICYSLPPDMSDNFRNTLDWEVLLSEEEKFPTMFGQLTVGGIFVVDRERYMRAGMENEYFLGWGPEDIERLKRLTILDLPVSRVKGCIYHLYHPRKLNSGYVDRSQNLSAKKELLRICRMGKADLLEEIADWSWDCKKVNVIA